jgi:hypothetical protein
MSSLYFGGSQAAGDCVLLGPANACSVGSLWDRKVCSVALTPTGAEMAALWSPPYQPLFSKSKSIRPRWMAATARGRKEMPRCLA